MKDVFRGRTAPLIFLAALVVVCYADILFLGRGMYLTDLTSYHYPIRSIVREVVSGGHFPYWNRYYSGGQPMAANPAYEIFYPPQWLIFLPSYHFGFQLFILVHFFIGGAGMFLLARSLGVSVFASLFAAVSFIFGGTFLSVARLLPLLFSLAWMPLALYFARRFLLERRWAPFAGASAAVAMQMLIGEPTVAAQTWLLMIGYAVYAGRASARPKSILRLDGLKPVLRSMLLVGAIFFAGALLAAVQLVPGFDHASDSVRSQSFDYRVVGNWSLPIDRPLEFAWPSIFRNLRGMNGQPAIRSMYPFRTDAFIAEIYLGLLVVILAIAGLFAGVRGRGVALLVTLGALFIAWGEHTPLLRVLYDIGAFRNIRYPEKFVITAVVVLVLWAALVLDRLLSGDRKVGATASVVALFFCVAAILIGLTQWGNAPSRWFFAGNVARAVAAFALILMVRRKPDGLWRGVLLGAVVVDLAIATHHVVPRMPRHFFDAPPIVEKIPTTGRVFHEAAWEVWDASGTAYAYFGERPLPDYFWIFRNGAFPNMPAQWNRELALEDDIDQTALSTTSMFLEAFKLARRGGPGAEEGFLRLSNVTSRLRFRPTDTMTADPSKSMPVEVVPATSHARYAFAERLESVADSVSGFASQVRDRGTDNVAFVTFEPFAPARGEVLSVQESPNAAILRVRAEGRAFLVASVTNHKWWSATLDGGPLNIVTTNLTYQGLEVPPGEHVVMLRYRNPLIRAGALVSLLALAALVGLTVFDNYRGQEYLAGTDPS